MGILKRVGNKLIQADENWKNVGKGLKDVKNAIVANQNVHSTASNIASNAQKKVFSELTPGEQPDEESSIRAIARDKEKILKDPIKGTKEVVENWKTRGEKNINYKKYK